MSIRESIRRESLLALRFACKQSKRSSLGLDISDFPVNFFRKCLFAFVLRLLVFKYEWVAARLFIADQKKVECDARDI